MQEATTADKYQDLGNVVYQLSLCVSAAGIHIEQFDVAAVEYQLKRAAEQFKNARKIVDAIKKDDNLAVFAEAFISAPVVDK